jgi:hypothetical protein
MELEILDGHHLIQENKSIYKVLGTMSTTIQDFCPNLRVYDVRDCVNRHLSIARKAVHHT